MVPRLGANHREPLALASGLKGKRSFDRPEASGLALSAQIRAIRLDDPSLPMGHSSQNQQGVFRSAQCEPGGRYPVRC